MIKRYTIIDGILVEDDNGELVKFSDHNAIVSLLKKNISDASWDAEYTRDYYESTTMRRNDQY